MEFNFALDLVMHDSLFPEHTLDAQRKHTKE